MKDIAIVYVVNVYTKKWEEIPTNIKALQLLPVTNTNEFYLTLKVTTHNRP